MNNIETLEIPEILPILPVRNVVLFPWMVIPLLVAREKSVQLIDEAMEGDKIIGVAIQVNAEKEHPTEDDIVRFGTAGLILKMLKLPDGSQRILIQGLKRIKIHEFISDTPYFRAKVEVIEEFYIENNETEILVKTLKENFQKFVENTTISADTLSAVLNTGDPGRLVDFISANINLKAEEMQDILETVDLKDRIKKVTLLLARQLELKEIASNIQKQVKNEMDKTQREYYLREQLKAIRKELGEDDSSNHEIEEFREKIAKAKMPPDVENEAKRELDRMSRMHYDSAEYTVSRTYLDWLVSLPWSISTEDNLDITRVQQVLDEDHYDLKKVKERITEYIAVRKLNPDMKGPILCFVGPPGVGKTSLGRSIARAVGRKFERMSLGGMKDESEIRGHRRTYIGAMPGRIINALRRASSNNPVIMLDEIDKVGTDFRGDPSSALLEVLDPEQNFSFTDHYLNVAFDLSKVMFIATANITDTIPPALKDRMEMLELPGYIEEEKIEIFKKHIMPKVLKEHGLEGVCITIPTSCIKTIIRDYTREAGLRNLEREFASICRKIATKIAKNETENKKFKITEKVIKEYLGPKKFYSELAERTNIPGIAIGVAWTQFGGDILFIESTKMKGQKSFKVTGQLGDVMKESAEAALSYIRANSSLLNIDESVFEKIDIHVHIPAGAIPKDGPSAGITIATSLASLLTERKVRHDIAMTGEITLRGKVLPVGGIKEKVLAARRAGIKNIIIPKRNEKDLEEIPAHLKKDMKFFFVTNVEEVLKLSLEKK